MYSTTNIEDILIVPWFDHYADEEAQEELLVALGAKRFKTTIQPAKFLISFWTLPASGNKQ